MSESAVYVHPPDEDVARLLAAGGIRIGPPSEARAVIVMSESYLRGLPQQAEYTRTCLVLYGRFPIAAVKEAVKQHAHDYHITVVCALHGPEPLNVVSGHRSTELDPILTALGGYEYLWSNPVWAPLLSLVERQLYAVHTVLAAETLSIGAKAGLDTQILYDAICGAAGSSWAFKSCGPNMLREFHGSDGTTVSEGEALADVTEFCLEAKNCSIQAPLSSMSRQLLVTACSLGLAEQHVSAVAKVYSELGNVSLVPKAAKILQPETDSSKRAKVALIGLGTKGLGMAKVLRQAGFNVHSFDLDSSPIGKRTAMRANGSSSVVETVKGADVVILMVVNAAQAADVLFILGGADAMSPGAVICLMSTVSPSAAIDLDDHVQALGRDLGFIDCPVSGGPFRATIGDLTILASGREKHINKALPVLQALSGAKGNTANLIIVDHSVGKASAVKLVNQHLSATQIISTAEALAFVAEQGLPPTQTLAILQRSAGDSWMLRDRGGRMLSGLITPPTSTVTISVKDISIVVDEAQVFGVPVFMAVTAQQQINSGVKRGQSGRDDSSAVRMLSDASPH